jgi:hypothetical protein
MNGLTRKLNLDLQIRDNYLELSITTVSLLYKKKLSFNLLKKTYFTRYT